MRYRRGTLAGEKVYEFKAKGGPIGASNSKL